MRSLRITFFILLIIPFSCDKSSVASDNTIDVSGCTDELATNYNESATIDDGTCSYYNSIPYNKIYVTLQSTDKVAILNSQTLEIIEIIDINLMDMDDGMGMGDMMGETPHYVILDEINGYFFVSAIMSNKIGMYSIENNELIGSLSVDEDPAILGIDVSSNKLYVSRMMIMNMGDMGMGSTASLIDEINYDSNGMTLIQTHDSGVPTPHGIALNSSYILTASNTTDFLSRINRSTGSVSSISLDPSVNDNPNIEINRLKPLEIAINGDYAFITCSAGQWQNINTGESEDISGQVQVWQISTLEKIASYEFNVSSKPWHIVVDNSNYVYVALSGSSSGSAGVSKLYFDGTEIVESWTTLDDSFSQLHGIAIDNSGNIYVSGRGDGNLYKFDSSTGALLNSINLVSTGMTRTGGINVSDFEYSGEN